MAKFILSAFADEASPVFDEQLRILREEGLSEKSMRGKVDMVAASVFLQAWLDANSKEGTNDGEA